MGILLRTCEIDRLVSAAVPADDAELLRRYRDAGDAEAFETIVRRHARTVLGVCQRVLRDPHAAEDAFQATFLQLARRARAVRSPGALAAWLCATARRTALRHRRPTQAPPAESHVPGRTPLDLLTARELLCAIEEEIARLPEVYRLPLILCYADGLTKGEAADRLGLAAGVLRGRLDRGREKLRLALIRRGFAPTAALGLLVPSSGSASAELVTRTVGICASGEPIPAAVALLAVGRTATLLKATLTVGLLLLGGLGLIAAAGRIEPPAPRPDSPAPRPEKAESRHDLYGDPLPPDAIARMGSIRWRHADDFRTYIDVTPSPTGKLVATVSRGDRGKGLVRVWDLSDGQPACAFPWDDAINAWNLDFTADGSRLMTLADSGVVKFYDPRTGKVLGETKPVLEKEDVYSRASVLTADRRWVVTRRLGSGINKLLLTEIVADPATKPRRVELDSPPGAFNFNFASFSGDGNTLVSDTREQASGWKPTMLHWDVGTGKLKRKTLIESKNAVVTATPDGKRVATWRYDGPPHDVLRVWDSETGAEVVELEGAVRKGYGAIRFSPDGKRLVARTDRNETTQTAVVWELDRGKVIARVTVPGWCNRIFLLPDGKTILAASSGMMFGTWDMATGRRLSPITGHESDVQHLAFTPDGKTLLTASTDPEERVTAWDAMTGKKLQELAAPHGPPILIKPTMPPVPFVLTPGGAVVTTGKGALIWTDMKTGRELRRVAPKPIATAMDLYDCFQVERVSLTHDPQTGRSAVLGVHSFGPSPYSSEQKHKWKDVVTLWDAESGELLAHRTETRDHYDWNSGAVSSDGRLLARYSHDSTAEQSVVIGPALGGRGSFKLKQPDELSRHYLFSPDSQCLMTTTRKRAPEGHPAEPFAVRLWEVRSGKQRLAFSVPFEPSAFAFSPDGRFLAVERTANKTISIWELATGAEVAKRSGYRSLIETLAFRPDGQALASGHTDGTALVWDLSGLPGVKRAATDREAAWKDLASANAGTAYRAILSLAADPGCVAVLRDKVKPAPAVPAGQLQQLVKDLGDDEFRTREAATEALAKLGGAVEAELRMHSHGNVSPEQQRRIADVLAKQTLTESDPNHLRELRCVEVLERVGSAEARSVLGEWAKGVVGAKLTREAGGALRRFTTPPIQGK